MAATKPERAPILAERTPSVKYNKRYDQVSWRSADTDFEPEPSLGNGMVEVKKGKYTFCTKRNRKLTALVIVVVIFLIIMAALIYLYYSKPSVVNATAAIDTDCGQLKGVVYTITNLEKTYQLNVFKGIPYALPPIGNLRWTAPKSLSQDASNCWKGVFKAYQYASKCAQGRYEGSEDCLYLNVFTPKLTNDANLPVFVWIHGGYLISGSSDSINSSPNAEFSNLANAVVVKINYRLNAFGFLTLKELWQEGKSYANFGIMDQILALKWIKKNIKNFGGNPDSVTICGQNSGGSSVLALLTSPSAKGLFHKAISMSGLPKMDMPYKIAAKQNRVFLKKTRCSNLTAASDIRRCLYNLTTNEVLDGYSYIVDFGLQLIKEDLLAFPAKGVVEGGLIVIDPIIVVTPPNKISKASQKIDNKISVLIGSTAQEIGISPSFTFVGNDQWSNMQNHLSKYLTAFSPNLTDKVFKELYDNKSINEDISDDYSTDYIYESIVSDVRENCPTNSLFKALLNTGKYHAYRYVVTHRPAVPITIFNHKARFAFHTWDKIALFNFESIRKDYTPNENDQRFHSNLLQNFKHFMMFGHMENSDWGNGVTAIFSQNGDTVVLPVEYNEKQCLFWNNPTNGFVPYAWSD